jgi:hypothetical protein
MAEHAVIRFNEGELVLLRVALQHARGLVGEINDRHIDQVQRRIEDALFGTPARFRWR